jgi:aromatic-L-amino-acid/L-tryptophan decarboxylase
MFVKRRQDLIDTLSITPSYLRNRHSAAGDVTDYRDWQFGLSRRFRALKIWFVMRTYGVDGFQAHVRAHVKLGELFHSLVASRPDLFQILGMPAFALTTVAVTPQHRSLAICPVRKYRVAKVKPAKASGRMVMSANKLTETVYETILSRGRINLTSTMVGNTYVIRVPFAHPKIEEKYVRRAFDILVETTEEVL